MSDQDADFAGSTEFLLLSPSEWRLARRARLAALRDSPDSFIPTRPHETSWGSRRWRRSCRAGRWAVARTDGIITGVARLTFEHDGPHLGSVWTHPCHRRRGIASELVRLLVGQVDAGEVLVWVIHPNEAAFELYESLKFERTNEIQTLQRIGRDEERLRFDLG